MPQNSPFSTPDWFKPMEFFNQNASGINAVAQLGSGLYQMNMGNKLYGLQKDAYNYNKMLSELERKRRDQADANFAQGFANSSYGKGA